MSDVLDLDDIANLFRVTPTAVRNWCAAGLPVKEVGTRGGARRKTRISLKAVVTWYFRENFERLELDRQRTQLAKEQGDRIALENAERRGDLVRVSAMEAAFANAVTVAQARLLAIPSKEAPMLAPMNDANAIEQRLTQAIHDALNELAAYGSGEDKGSGRNNAGDGEVRAAAAANRQRVGRGKQAAQ